VGVCVYIARCCAPFTLAHKNQTSAISCGDDSKPKNLEKKEQLRMATKKGGKKKAAKKAAPKKAAKKKAAKKR
jgi:hypothetical protein